MTKFLSWLMFQFLMFFSRHLSPRFTRHILLWGLKGYIFKQNVKISPKLRTILMDRVLKSPIGLSADFDRKAEMVDLLYPLGLGFCEIGSFTVSANNDFETVTFIPKYNAIKTVSNSVRNVGVQRGVHILAARRHFPQFAGVSLMSFGVETTNSMTGNVVYQYIEDFKQMAIQVAPYVDYVVVNLSHPNMSLAQLVGDESTILPLLKEVREALALAAPIKTPKMVLKVPFDLSDLEVKQLGSILLKSNVDAVIVSGAAGSGKYIREIMQETLSISDIKSFISGAPLKKGVQRLVKMIYLETRGRVKIIANGGIFSGRDVYDMIRAGATAVQIATVLLYKGPAVINKMNVELAQILDKNKIPNLQSIIGVDVHEDLALALKKDQEQGADIDVDIHSEDVEIHHDVKNFNTEDMMESEFADTFLWRS